MAFDRSMSLRKTTKNMLGTLEEEVLPIPGMLGNRATVRLEREERRRRTSSGRRMSEKSTVVRTNYENCMLPEEIAGKTERQ